MSTIIFLVAFVAALGFIYKAQRQEKSYTKGQEGTSAGAAREQMWQDAAEQAESSVDRVLLSASRTFAVASLTDALQKSSLQDYIQKKLLAAGRAFNNSTEVFFSVVTLLTLVAAIALILAFIASGTLIKLFLALLAFVCVYYPYSSVVDKAKTRARQITEELPDFVEILQMPILAGSGGIVDALSFTADRTTGHVSTTVKEMLVTIRSKTLTTQEAFLVAGRNLGTPAAIAFFNALMQSYIEGARVSQTLAAQSKALRIQAEEARLADLERLPIKLVIIFTFHLLPLLIVLVLIPTAVSFMTGAL